MSARLDVVQPTPHPEGRPRGKFGALPHAFDPHDFKFGSFIKTGVVLEDAPVGYQHDRWTSDFGMLGNDSVGDCVLAGAGHETEIWTYASGKGVALFAAANTLKDYSAITGYDPADPNTDQGTDPIAAAKYRRRTGVADAAGHRHKIGAFVTLETGNWHEALQALRIFETVAFCFDVPESAMEQFDAGHRWSYVRDTNIVGGHYVCWGARPGISVGEAITWGQRQQFTRSFFQHYNSLGIAYVSTEALTASGKTLEGFDLAALNQALGELPS